MTEIKQPCPAPDCGYIALANVDTSIVPKAERKELLQASHKRLAELLQKHHDDGHPKDGQ